MTHQGAVLVTGAGGLLGRFAVERFTALGWRVTALTRLELDITRERDVAAAIDSGRPDAVINCAAMTDVDRCETEPEMAFAVNERGPANLATVCRAVGAALVHVSTDYVFDGSKPGFYTQEDEPRPLSVYAESKLAGEIAVRSACSRHFVVRSSWIFGPGGKNFGSRVIELARTGKPLKGVTDQVSIPTYAPDLAGRMEEILRLGVVGTYHVTSAGPATWFEFARLALDLAGMSDVGIEPVTREQLGLPAARPENSAMRCLLSERLGWPPLRHWRDALKEFVGGTLER